MATTRPTCHCLPQKPHQPVSQEPVFFQRFPLCFSLSSPEQMLRLTNPCWRPNLHWSHTESACMSACPLERRKISQIIYHASCSWWSCANQEHICWDSFLLLIVRTCMKQVSPDQRLRDETFNEAPCFGSRWVFLRGGRQGLEVSCKMTNQVSLMRSSGRCDCRDQTTGGHHPRLNQTKPKQNNADTIWLRWNSVVIAMQKLLQPLTALFAEAGFFPKTQP